MEKKWTKLATQEEIKKTIDALKKNGINAELVRNREEAKKKAMVLIPEGAEIMTMTSLTLDTIGIANEINVSDKFQNTRKKFAELNQTAQKREMKNLGAAPEYAIGSAHAITQNGEILVASNSGSQLPAYAYGSDHVIFVVGTQKIVRNRDDGFKRIYEHSLPLESERAKKAYNVPGSNISKILIINKELQPDRINVIFIPEVLGF